MLKRALLLCTILSVFALPAVAASTLDANTIKLVHDETKKSLADKCIKEMKGATPTICSCLGDKASMSLDDAVLATCASDDSGAPCITDAVSKAARIATTQDSVNACVNIATAAPAQPGSAPQQPTTAMPQSPTTTTMPQPAPMAAPAAAPMAAPDQAPAQPADTSSDTSSDVTPMGDDNTN